jgi:hypothetical protein
MHSDTINSILLPFGILRSNSAWTKISHPREVKKVDAVQLTIETYFQDVREHNLVEEGSLDAPETEIVWLETEESQIRTHSNMQISNTVQGKDEDWEIKIIKRHCLSNHETARGSKHTYHSFHHHCDANNEHSKGHEAIETCSMQQFWASRHKATSCDCSKDCNESQQLRTAWHAVKISP